VKVPHNSTYLIPDQFLKKFMPCNGENKAGKEHTQRDDNGSRECITERSIDKSALKPNESYEND
jgi:hypothetical protein